MRPDLSKLSAPFPPERVSWRVGSTTERDGKTKGMALAYVDARDIMDRLDSVVGPANWQDKYRREHETTICSLSIRIDGEWITKEDGSGDTDVEAEKGALSKALVRAAVKWQIGRYLYDLKSPWVECEKRGRSTIIKDTEHARLEAILRRVQVPQQQPQRQSDRHINEDAAQDDEPTWSQMAAQSMADALLKRAGPAAVEAFLARDQVKDALSRLEMDDHTWVMRIAAERRAVEPVTSGVAA